MVSTSQTVEFIGEARGLNEGCRYVLIPFETKETNRLITGVVSTFNEVTVDSPSFKSKNELGTRWVMRRQRRQACV